MTFASAVFSLLPAGTLQVIGAFSRKDIKLTVACFGLLLAFPLVFDFGIIFP